MRIPLCFLSQSVCSRRVSRSVWRALAFSLWTLRQFLAVWMDSSKRLAWTSFSASFAVRAATSFSSFLMAFSFFGDVLLLAGGRVLRSSSSATSSAQRSSHSPRSFL